MTDITYLFSEERIGTKLLDEERQSLYSQIKDYEQKMNDPQWIEEEVSSNIELFGSWDRDLTLLCLEHDLHFMRLTLESGIIQMQ